MRTKPKAEENPKIEIKVAPKMTEPEITLAMEEAGISRLGELIEASLAYQAKEVFLAMWAARPKNWPQSVDRSPQPR